MFFTKKEWIRLILAVIAYSVILIFRKENSLLEKVLYSLGLVLGVGGAIAQKKLEINKNKRYERDRRNKK